MDGLVTFLRIAIDLAILGGLVFAIVTLVTSRSAQKPMPAVGMPMKCACGFEGLTNKSKICFTCGAPNIFYKGVHVRSLVLAIVGLAIIIPPASFIFFAFREALFAAGLIEMFWLPDLLQRGIVIGFTIVAVFMVKKNKDKFNIMPTMIVSLVALGVLAISRLFIGFLNLI